MWIKVNDSKVPPRQSKWSVLKTTNGVDLFLQDTKVEAIGCCVQMDNNEAYELAMQILEMGAMKHVTN